MSTFLCLTGPAVESQMRQIRQISPRPRAPGEVRQIARQIWRPIGPLPPDYANVQPSGDRVSRRRLKFFDPYQGCPHVTDS